MNPASSSSPWHRLALTALALRLLFAAGFMPSALDSGWLVTLCHQGLPAAALAGNGHHHHGAQDPELLVDSGDFCPLGTALDGAVGLPILAPLAISLLPPAPPARRDAPVPGRRLFLKPPSRAPPILS
ncbi:MAG: hypothetical protein AAGA23_14890 [Pseudomonadota bacterium]